LYAEDFGPFDGRIWLNSGTPGDRFLESRLKPQEPCLNKRTDHISFGIWCGKSCKTQLRSQIAAQSHQVPVFRLQMQRDLGVGRGGIALLVMNARHLRVRYWGLRLNIHIVVGNDLPRAFVLDQHLQ
jgi:hypothetical protein